MTSVLFSGEFSPFFDKEIGIILEAIFFQDVNSTNFAKKNWVKFSQCFYMEIKTLEGIPCYLGTWRRLEAALFRSYFISTSRRSTFVLAFCVLSMLQNYKILTRRLQQIISDCPWDVSHLQTLHLHYCAFCSRAQTKDALYPVMCCQ